MTLLDRPKNNIHLHITWFNAQKPQIPRPSTEERKDYAQTSAIGDNLLDSVTARTVATQVVPPIHAPMSLAHREALNIPTPTNIRDTPAAAPKLPELKTPGQGITASSSELPSITQDACGRRRLNGAKKEMVGNGTGYARALLNLLDVQTPRITTTPYIPSTRDTINLVSDDETDVTVKKRDHSLSPVQNAVSNAVPTTVTMRKRIVKDDLYDETPSRPANKKQKSPTGEAIPMKASAGSKLKHSVSKARRSPSPSILPRPALSGNPSFTQIPDSEAEDDDDLFGGDEFIFNTDDIPYDANKFPRSALAPSTTGQYPTNTKQQDDNIVPESPFKVGRDEILASDLGDRRDQSPVVSSLQTSAPAAHVHPTMIEGSSKSTKSLMAAETITTVASSSVNLNLIPCLTIDYSLNASSKYPLASYEKNMDHRHVAGCTCLPPPIDRASRSPQDTETRD
jgi:hypothetical protein